MEMTRSLVIPMTELLGHLARDVEIHISTLILEAEKRQVLEIALEEFFYGFEGEEELTELLEGWGLSGEAILEVMGKTRRRTWETVQLAFGIVYPGRGYSFQFRGADLVIHEAKVGDSRPMLTFSTEFDYIPERLRR